MSLNKGNPLHTDLPVVILRPGELHVAREPTLINTILGSCVAVCLYCDKTKMGAMCHGVMPYKAQSGVEEECFRFVDCSVHYMVDVMAKQQKIACPEIVVKLFGGANVFKPESGRVEQFRTSVGNQNVTAAKACLAKYGLKVSVEKIGGVNGLKLFFYTHTGDVLLKAIPRHLVKGI